MKSLFIFTAFTPGVLVSAIQVPNLLMDRAIDPATMNPTLFSVLSVLKTAMPVGVNVPTPTGDFEPDWYQKLPGDIKSLLPSFYPAATAAATVVSQVDAVESSGSVAQSEGVTSTDSVMSSASNVASSLFSSASSSSTPSTSQFVLTKTSQYASTATDMVSASSSVPASDGASQITSSAALANAPATPSSSLSPGARFTVKTETLAVIALSSVGAAFCIFA